MIPEFTIQDAELFNNMQHYEIEIEFLNELANKLSVIQLEKIIKKNILYVVSGLQFSNFPLPYDKQNNILKEHLELVMEPDNFNEIKKDNAYNFKKESLGEIL